MLIHAGGEWELWILIGNHSAGGCQARDANGIPNLGDFLNPVCVPVMALLVERKMETLERHRNVAMEPTPPVTGGTGWLALLHTRVLDVLTHQVVGFGLIWNH